MVIYVLGHVMTVLPVLAKWRQKKFFVIKAHKQTCSSFIYRVARVNWWRSGFYRVHR